MSDENYIDYHEAFPTRWEITAAYAICCAKCHETKLAKHFRRPLTRAQAAARGYRGMSNQDDQPKKFKGDRLATVESKYCAKCQPGHYKPNDMTVKEMYLAAYDGKASLTRVNIDAERKRAKASAKISAAVSDRWERWKSAPWIHVRARLADELEITTRRISYFNTRGAGKPGQDKLLGALTALQETMTALRARCTINARIQAPLDPATTWGDMTGTPVMSNLQALWSEVPADVLMRMKNVPLLLNKAQPLVMDGYVAPNQGSIDRLNTVKGHEYGGPRSQPPVISLKSSGVRREMPGVAHEDQDSVDRLQAVKDHVYGADTGLLAAPRINMSKWARTEGPVPTIRLGKKE
jgi:hypothetical protein